MLVGFLGLSGAGLWVILIGAAGLTIELWVDLHEVMRKKPPASPLDWNMVGFYSGAVVNHLAMSTTAYLVGYFLAGAPG